MQSVETLQPQHQKMVGELEDLAREDVILLEADFTAPDDSSMDTTLVISPQVTEPPTSVMEASCLKHTDQVEPDSTQHADSHCDADQTSTRSQFESSQSAVLQGGDKPPSLIERSSMAPSPTLSPYGSASNQHHGKSLSKARGLNQSPTPLPPACLEGALQSLDPDAQLSSTAIELVLKSLSLPSQLILDPTFADPASGSGFSGRSIPKVRDHVETILLPITHNGHHSLVIFDLLKQKISYFDSNLTTNVIPEPYKSLIQEFTARFLTSHGSFALEVGEVRTACVKSVISSLRDTVLPTEGCNQLRTIPYRERDL